MIYLILLFSMLPSIVYANDTLNPPTIFATERLMIFSFIFIITLEAWIFYKRLPGLSVRQYIYTGIRANLVTMFIAVPIVWGIWFVLMRVISESYIMPIYNETLGVFLISPWTSSSDSLLWAEWRMFPLYFIVSYYIEY